MMFIDIAKYHFLLQARRSWARKCERFMFLGFYCSGESCCCGKPSCPGARGRDPARELRIARTCQRRRRSGQAAKATRRPAWPAAATAERGTVAAAAAERTITRAREHVRIALVGLEDLSQLLPNGNVALQCVEGASTCGKT